MRSSIGFGYTPQNTIRPTNGSSSMPSFRRSSGKVRLSSFGSPWNTRWYAHSRYSAAKITPAVATTVHHRAVRNEPISTRYSPTKPLRPGTPIDDSITIMNVPAKIGATFWMPPNSEISRV